MALPLNQVNVDCLLIYLEFLAINKFSPSHIANQLAGIKANFVIYSLETAPFENEKIKYFIRSLRLNSPLRVTLHTIIDIPLLSKIVSQCDNMFMGQIFKATYLLGFFSFLRLSNLVPHTQQLFSPLKHLTPADIFFKQDTAVILIKWSKTLQLNNQIKLLHIPCLNNALCPVRALKNVLKITPHSNNSPLFQFRSSSGAWAPMTDNQVRSNLKMILKNLNLPSAHVTFHRFRRSGATFAFHNNVPLQAIKN